MAAPSPPNPSFVTHTAIPTSFLFSLATPTVLEPYPQMAAARQIPLTRLRAASISSHFLSEEEPQSATAARARNLPFARSRGEDEEEADFAPLRPEWKASLFALLERPASSPAAFFIHVFLNVLIVTSSLVTVLETVPTFHSISGRTWFGLETSLVALFTIEYVARCVAWSGSWRSLLHWLKSFYGIIDLLAILPYYIEIALQQDTSVFFRFSILRVLRLLRMFRYFKSNHSILLTIEVMYLSLRRSEHALYALSFFLITILMVFSALLYFAERGTWDSTLETFINSNGDVSQFSSIPAAAWFVLVTITTVGYGEIFPVTFLGRLVTLPLLLLGMVLIALPSFVVGREFSIVWAELSADNDDPSPEGGARGMSAVAADPFGTRPSVARSTDLSNRKLAQNQTELARQIVELRAAVDQQNALMRQILERLPSGEGARGKSPVL